MRHGSNLVVWLGALLIQIETVYIYLNLINRRPGWKPGMGRTWKDFDLILLLQFNQSHMFGFPVLSDTYPIYTILHPESQVWVSCTQWYISYNLLHPEAQVWVSCTQWWVSCTQWYISFTLLPPESKVWVSCTQWWVSCALLQSSCFSHSSDPTEQI